MKRSSIIFYISLMVLFFVVTIGCTYYALGGIIPGINDLKVYQQEGITRYVAGLPYQGEAKSKEAGELFLKYRDWIDKDIESATVTAEIMRRGEVERDRLQFNFLSVINFPTETEEIDQFIGVAIRGRSGQIPMGNEEVREFKCDIRYSVFLTMNSFVRPPSWKVENLILERAAANGDSIAYFYEIYYPDNSMQIDGFVVD